MKAKDIKIKGEGICQLTFCRRKAHFRAKLFNNKPGGHWITFDVCKKCYEEKLHESRKFNPPERIGS